MPPRFAPKAATVEDPIIPKTVEAPAPVSPENAHTSLIDTMRVHLAKQPKVEVRVHNDGDVFVQINGYSYLVQPNVKVLVPAPVAKLLDEAGYL
jgi:hypothetical protein